MTREGEGRHTLALALGAGAAVLLMIGVLVGQHGAEGSVPHVVRWTARSSLLLFVGALVASAGAGRSKHGLLIGLATSHLLHAVGIAALAVQTQGANIAERGLLVVGGGGVGYAAIGMAALRPHSRWAGTGLLVIWAIFLFAYLPRALAAPTRFLPAVLLLVGALAYRLFALSPGRGRGMTLGGSGG